MIKTIRNLSPIFLAIVLGLISFGLLVFYNLPNLEHLHDGNLGKIGGEPVSRDDFRVARDGVVLMLRLERGEIPGGEETNRLVNNLTWQHLVILQAAKEMNLRIGDEQVATAIQNLFHGQDGKYDPARYDQFVHGFLAQQNVSEDRFNELIREELLSDKVSAAVAAPAQVAPAEVDRIVGLRFGAVKATEIRFRAADFASQVVLDPAQVEKAYPALAENPAYRTAELRAVSWVPFLLSPAEEKLDAKAKADAKRKLGQAAQDFAIAALDQAKDDPKAFASLAAALGAGHEVQAAAPFAASAAPATLPSGAAAATFQLTPELPVSDPLATDHGYYVLQLGAVTASEALPLDKVRPLIEGDLRSRFAAQKARDAGEAYAKALKDALAAGKPFPAAIQEAAAKSQAKPAVVSVPAFVPVDSAKANLPDAPSLVPLSFSLQPGQASDFAATDDGGLIVFVEKRDAAAPAVAGPGRTQVEAQILNQRRENLLNDWFSARTRQAGFEQPSFLKGGDQAE